MILKEIMNVNDTRIMAIVTTRSREVFSFKSILPVLIGCFNVKCYPAIDEKLVLQHAGWSGRYTTSLCNTEAAMKMKVLGGSRKESSKYLRVQGGRVLYQFTIRVKLPQEASGARYGF